MKTMTLIALSMLMSFNLLANDSRKLSFTQKNLPVSLDTLKTLDESYHTIGSIEVTELEVTEEDQVEQAESSNKGLGEIIMVANKLLALGKKIWAIVEAGRPVVNSTMMQAISVIPKTSENGGAFYDMENWSAPRVRKYRVVYKNLFGMKVVSFTYVVHYQYNGSYEGKGKYLTGVNINAADISVAWGFEFNAKSQLVAISNRGSRANPLASATLQIDYVAKSVLKEIRSSESFHISGDGRLIQMH